MTKRRRWKWCNILIRFLLEWGWKWQMLAYKKVSVFSHISSSKHPLNFTLINPNIHKHESNCKYDPSHLIVLSIVLCVILQEGKKLEKFQFSSDICCCCLNEGVKNFTSLGTNPSSSYSHHHHHHQVQFIFRKFTMYKK